jgi:hypothetical protein
MSELLVTEQVQAYVNHGRWIADCCRPYCTSARLLSRGMITFYCDPDVDEGCGMEATVIWPTNVNELTEVLGKRPVKATRNWFPAGHELAIKSNCPHGQTVQQLKDEQMEMEAR